MCLEVKMSSVTHRIKNEIKQPRGGYIGPTKFTVVDLQDGKQLHEEENVYGSLVGSAVDYLTRVDLGAPAEEAFRVSLAGSAMVNAVNMAFELLRDIDDWVFIKRTDDDAEEIKTALEKAIIAACKLSGFDVCVRSSPVGYRPVENINPDENTIENIKIMLERTKSFFQKYGPITLQGFNFEGGYTDLITSGDGDFLTEDTLWDFKVLQKKPTNKETLQLLVYYLMGKHSVHPEFQTIEKLGLFNPRHNKVYLLNVSDIPDETLKAVSRDVIGYM